ncbi:MAG: sulfite exporter TauE/SafE family protein [Ferruginibacter sp.]
MTVYLLSALIMGAAGSLHCVGMCGPLALSLPLKDSSSARFAGTFLYNIGRALMYAGIGILSGLAGSSFRLMGLQQWLSVGLGILILLYVVLPRAVFFRRADHRMQQWFAALRQQLGVLFRQKKMSSVFFIGILNGLLPCGLVYMAATVAAASASVWNSALYMFFFGLGTMPLMWSISFFGTFFSVRTRAGIRKAYPYMMSLVACLLIIRGLGLGIPYVSPAAEKHAAGIAIQCHPVK